MADATRSHTKVSRLDWIEAALSALGETPIDSLRVLTLATDLDVSRSSFYWYFDDLADLQGELLATWERNTRSIIERSRREAPTIIAVILGVFECWADQRLYDAQLDLAVRDWGRRNPTIGTRVAAADDERLDAVTAMFARHGFADNDAVVRARLLYHSQVGYYALGTDEPMATRLGYLPYYLEALADCSPTTAELAVFEEFLGTTR